LFTTEPTAESVGAQFLHICSWNFVATGLVFTCSGVFQGLGNTMPAVWSSASRLVSFVVPALWLAAQPNFEIVQLWYVSVASVSLQALISLALVRSEFRKRLRGAAQSPSAASPVPAES
jgi:Na+-driven multidrug efflux pump